VTSPSAGSSTRAPKNRKLTWVRPSPRFGDESAAAARVGENERRRSESYDGNSAPSGPHGSGVRRPHHQAAAAAAHHDPDEDGNADRYRKRFDEAGALVGTGESNEDQQEGETDSVVEARFDVERLANPFRDTRVRDHRLAERRIGWRRDCPDDRGLPDAEVGEQQRCEDRPKPNRQGKTDTKEAARDIGVPLPRREMQWRCTGEQQQGKRSLENDVDDVDSLDRVTGDDPETVCAGEQTEGDEHHRSGDRCLREPPFDQGEGDERDSDVDDCRHQPSLFTASRAPVADQQPERRMSGSSGVMIVTFRRERICGGAGGSYEESGRPSSSTSKVGMPQP
jgi:hypothetical protein